MTSSGVRFLYVPAADLAAMRHFYTDLVGLDEIYFESGDSLGYNCAGFQFTVLHDASAPRPPAGWATQPGWRGNTVGSVSWSVELDEGPFRATIDRLRSAGVERLHDQPAWVGYWSFPVKDPAGFTVEIAWPADTPESSDWATN